MSGAGEVLAALRAQDIRLMVNGDQLGYDAPAGAVTAEVMALLRYYKAGLLAVLSQNVPASESTTTAPTRPAPLTPHYPCVVCGSTTRWEDCGIWRCRRCWPPGSLAQQATPHTFCTMTGGAI